MSINAPEQRWRVKIRKIVCVLSFFLMRHLPRKLKKQLKLTKGDGAF